MRRPLLLLDFTSISSDYPNQYHGISVPSCRKDRLERYLAWYEKYLKSPSTPAPAGR